jgi:SAM-dependent methyltransferase
MESAPDLYAPSAPFYDLIPLYSERADVDFYVDEARRSEGPVLELGCGTGRVLIPTARAGRLVTGLDRSRAMLARCAEKLQREPSQVQRRVELVEASMCDFDLRFLFALITCPFRAFQHLETAEEQVQALRLIHRHLAPGGRFVFDVFDPDLDLMTNLRDGEWQPQAEFTDAETGARITRKWRRLSWERHAQITRNEFLYERVREDGAVERTVHAFSMRILFRWEAEHLLARCGFRVLEVFRDFERNPIIDGVTKDLVFICDRRD